MIHFIIIRRFYHDSENFVKRKVQNLMEENDSQKLRGFFVDTKEILKYTRTL